MWCVFLVPDGAGVLVRWRCGGLVVMVGWRLLLVVGVGPWPLLVGVGGGVAGVRVCCWWCWWVLRW